MKTLALLLEKVLISKPKIIEFQIMSSFKKPQPNGIRRSRRSIMIIIANGPKIMYQSLTGGGCGAGLPGTTKNIVRVLLQSVLVVVSMILLEFVFVVPHPMKTLQRVNVKLYIPGARRPRSYELKANVSNAKQAIISLLSSTIVTLDLKLFPD